MTNSSSPTTTRRMSVLLCGQVGGAGTATVTGTGPHAHAKMMMGMMGMMVIQCCRQSSHHTVGSEQFAEEESQFLRGNGYTR
mmetsp:Transcript_27741/g.38004  ORF Transcript_27741/g.38004 Transcript_27741/m.38004 type:complete len:82 (+) Transcript_27741:354-599(+)